MDGDLRRSYGDWLVSGPLRMVLRAYGQASASRRSTNKIPRIKYSFADAGIIYPSAYLHNEYNRSKQAVPIQEKQQGGGGARSEAAL